MHACHPSLTDLRQPAVLVLDAVRLINDDVAPVELAEEGLLLQGASRGDTRGGIDVRSPCGASSYAAYCHNRRGHTEDSTTCSRVMVVATPRPTERQRRKAACTLLAET